MKPFELLKQQAEEYCNRDGRDGIWTEDQIFNRLVEEVGEMARLRRDPRLHRSNPDKARTSNIPDELLDVVFTAVTYSIRQRINLDGLWEEYIKR